MAKIGSSKLIDILAVLTTIQRQFPDAVVELYEHGMEGGASYEVDEITVNHELHAGTTTLPIREEDWPLYIPEVIAVMERAGIAIRHVVVIS